MRPAVKLKHFKFQPTYNNRHFGNINIQLRDNEYRINLTRG